MTYQDDEQFFQDVREELRRARSKFPRSVNQLLAFAEESGELVKAVLDHSYGKGTEDEVYAEAVQAAAMALRVAVEGDAGMPYIGTGYR